MRQESDKKWSNDWPTVCHTMSLYDYHVREVQQKGEGFGSNGVFFTRGQTQVAVHCGGRCWNPSRLIGCCHCHGR